MAPVLRVDDEVFKALQGRAEPFVDTPNSVLRRLLGLDSRGKHASLAPAGKGQMITSSMDTGTTPRVLVANCRPENWEGCVAQSIFGDKSPNPKAQVNDIILLRKTDPTGGRNYGVLAIWQVRTVRAVRQNEKLPWNDGPYHWVLDCEQVIRLGEPLNEGFDGPTKTSWKFQRLGVDFKACKLQRSLVELTQGEAAAYKTLILQQLGDGREEEKRRLDRLW